LLIIAFVKKKHRTKEGRRETTGLPKMPPVFQKSSGLINIKALSGNPLLGETPLKKAGKKFPEHPPFNLPPSYLTPN